MGNTLAHRYPPFSLDEYDDEYLGNCCLPDGGHIHGHDTTFLILHLKSPQPALLPTKKKKGLMRTQKKKDLAEEEVGASSAESGDTEGCILYGVAYFISRTDSTVKRGAIQKSILILSYHPYFNLFYKPAKAILERYLDDKSCKEGKTLLKTFYEAVQAVEKTQNYQLQLYGETYPINIPILDEVSHLSVQGTSGTDGRREG